MNNWDEIRTAYQVARIGTVSGAAEALGVHHATVIRHIDALEGRLGAKLFQRHARGYTATEAGEDLLKVAQATDDQFAQLAGRIKGQGQNVQGELIVTTLSMFGPLLTPVLLEYQEMYPDLVVRLLAGSRLFRLEYGEAHIAIRAGSAPQEPDNVAQPFFTTHMALYAHRSYVEKHGRLAHEMDIKNHRFVGADDENSRAPFFIWMRDNVPRENVVFRIDGMDGIFDAVTGGAGIGFMPV